MLGTPGWQLGPLLIAESIPASALITAALALGAWLLTRRLDEQPGRSQALVEGIVEAMEHAIAQMLPDHSRRVLPFIGTLWTYLVVANLLGLIPGLDSPTRDLSVTAALAVLVFLSVHWYGIRIQGLKGYLRHYLTPHPVMLPFHLISEVTRTMALAIRLFGNVMSMETAALLVLLVAGFLAPLPIHMLHIVEGLVQAYLFGMLALIYIASGIHTQVRDRNPTKE